MAKKHAVSVEIQGKDRLSPIILAIQNRVKGLEQGLAQAGARARTASTQMANGLQRVRQVAQATQEHMQSIAMAAGIAGVAMAGAGAALAAPLVKGVSVAGNFEKAMQGVKAVTGATGEAFDDLTTKAKELGASTEFTAIQAGEGMKFLGMAGYDTGQIISSIGPMLDLAVVGSLDLASAADYTSNIMQGFGLSADEAVRATDVLAQTATNSNTNVAQLAEAMKYAAPVARAMGMSIEKAAAFIGVLGNNGIQASMAGTGLRRMLVRLTDPSKEAQAALDSLGVQVAKNADGNINLEETLKRLRDANMGSAEAAKIFGVYALSSAQAVIKDLDALDKLTDKNENAAGALEQMAKTMRTGLVPAMTRLKSAAEGLMNALGSPFLGVLAKLVDGIAKIVGALANWASEHPKITAVLGVFTGVLASALIVVGSLLAAFAAFGFAAMGMKAGYEAVTAIKKQYIAATLSATAALQKETLSSIANTRAMNSATLAQAQFKQGWAATTAIVSGTQGKALESGLKRQTASLIGLGAALGRLGTNPSMIAGVAALASWGIFIRNLAVYWSELVHWTGEWITGVKDLAIAWTKWSDKIHSAVTLMDKMGVFTSIFKGITAPLIKAKDVLTEWLGKFIDIKAHAEHISRLLGLWTPQFTKEQAQEFIKRYEEVAERIGKISRKMQTGKALTKDEREDLKKAGIEMKTMNETIRKDNIETIEEFAKVYGIELPSAVQKGVEAAKKQLEKLKKSMAESNKEMIAFLEKQKELLEKINDEWKEASAVPGKSLDEQEIDFEEYSSKVQDVVDTAIFRIKSRIGELQKSLTAALKTGAPKDQINALSDALNQASKAGMKYFEDLAKSARTNLKQVGQALNDLERNYERERISAGDRFEAMRREIVRSRMTPQQKRYESEIQVMEKTRQARELMERGDELSLERAKELGRQVAEISREFKDPTMQYQTVQAGEMMFFEAQQRLAALNKQRLTEQKEMWESVTAKIQNTVEKLKEVSTWVAQVAKVKITIDESALSVVMAKMKTIQDSVSNIKVKLSLDKASLENTQKQIKEGIVDITITPEGAPKEPGTEPPAEKTEPGEVTITPHGALTEIGTAIQGMIGQLFDPSRIQGLMESAVSGLTASIGAMQGPTLVGATGMGPQVEVRLSPDTERILLQAAERFDLSSERMLEASEKEVKLEKLGIEIKNRSDGRVNAGLGSSTRFR